MGKTFNNPLILVEFKNCSPFVYRIKSKKVTLNKIVEYFEKTEGFNQERDSITILEEPTQIKI